ncbi:MarR family winged helix-turn-helix transcriptional regulator [Blastococcus sp. SYSU D00820]
MRNDGEATGAPRLVFGLMAAERSVRRWIDAQAGGTGIGAAGAGVLFHLAASGPALVGELAAALSASPAGTSGLVNRLAAAGLVEKTPEPQDARAVRVGLTEAGREAVRTARAVLDELNARLTDGFTPADLDTVGRWLAATMSSLAPTPTRR